MWPFEHYYYRAETDGVEFTSTPGGILDVDRLLKGDKCWKSLKPTTVLKPKTLVLADWTLAHQPAEYRQRLSTHLGHLLEHQANFTICVWQLETDSTTIKISLFISCAIFVTSDVGH